MPDEFDPEVACWDLAQALRRTANQWALAALHRDLIDAAAAGIQHEPVEWWHWADPPPPPPAPAHSPPRPVPVIEMEDGRRFLLRYGIEEQFLYKLETEELRAWGRPETMLADHRRVPPHVGIRIDWSDGGILRLLTGELMYDVRVEKVATGTPAMIPPLTLDNLARWYREYIRNGGRPSERAEIDAATEYFGEQVRKRWIQEVRIPVLKELQPELFDRQGNLRAGRRPA